MFTKLRNELKEPIVLAHHPLCGRFDDHFITLFGRKVCRGCFTVYPTAIIGVAIIALFGPLYHNTLFALAIIAFLINLGRFAVRRTELSAAAFNVMLGASLAMVVTSVVYAPPAARSAMIALAAVVFICYAIFKGYLMISMCRSCPSFGRFPHCTTDIICMECEAER